MQHQIELGYVILEFPDPESLTPVLAEVVGLTRGDSDSESVCWRNDGRARRLVVQRGPASDAVAIGIEAVDTSALDTRVDRLRDLGFVVTKGTDSEASARGVDRLVRARSPWGVDVEIVTGLAFAASPFESDLIPGGFHTAGVGFGHAVFATQDMEASSRFLIDGLGFGQSDWLLTEIAPDVSLEVRFFHCNERHHTIALALIPFEVPQKLHHLMFETKERDDVGAAFDRAWGTDLAIPNGLGRHDNDGMFSFYLQTNEGFQIEIGFGARVITESWDDNRRYDSISSWGHQPLRRG